MSPPCPSCCEMAIDLDVKLLACLMSMDVMEISRDDLIDEVDDVVGAATIHRRSPGITDSVVYLKTKHY